MGARHLLGAVGIVRGDRRQQAPMLLEGFGGTALRKQGAGLDLADMIEQRFQRLLQPAVMRGAADQLMKLAGEAAQRIEIAAPATVSMSSSNSRMASISDGVAFSAASRAAMPSSASRT